MGDWEIVRYHLCGISLVCNEAGVNPVWGIFGNDITQHGGGGKESNLPTK
jgi:hypothetical protein